VTVLAALALLVWLGVLLHPRRPYVPLGETSRPAPAPAAPLVSIVIPARDEAATIARAIRSHVESAWPRREIVLVDDGSGDETVAAARAAAAGAACSFAAIAAGDVPDGWVGKVRAMDRGLAASSGDYILFTDADIVFDPDLLPDLVAESEASGLGLNSRMAWLATASFWERLLAPAFVYFFGLLYPFRAVCAGRIASAAGGCMLVRRSALEAAGGLNALRDAIIDDIALARCLRGAGYPLRLALTKRARSLRRYRRLGDFWHTVTRTAFTELRYSAVRLAVATALLILSFVVPPAAVAWGLAHGSVAPAALGAGAAALAIGLYAPTVRYLEVPLPYAALLPLAGVLYLGMTWHSALRYVRGTRSAWKGRAYRR
jgi:hopene-associated glycosyltransferase HpnB